MRGAVLLLVGLGASACVVTRGPRDDLASRCGMGLDMWQQQYCAPGPKTVPVEAARMSLAEFESECVDAGSKARLQRLESTCIPQFFVAESTRRESRRQLRARYVESVSALLLDPTYAPAVDQHRDAEAQLNVSAASATASRHYAESHEVLVGLFQRYRIDPAHAKELDLW